MTRIVLLHGSWLGGWMCDDREALESAGKEVTALDFNGEGSMTTHRDEVTAQIDSDAIGSGATVMAHS